MSIIGKEIGNWALNSSVVNTTPLLLRLLLGVVAVLAIAMFTAVFSTAVICGLSLLAYHGLIEAGFNSTHAGGIVVLALIAIITLALLGLRQAWHKIAALALEISQVRGVFGRSIIGVTLSAFCEGFFNRLPR